MYQSGPVAYASPESCRVRTPTISPPVAGSSPANSMVSPGAVMSGPGALGRYASPSDSSSRWTLNTAAFTPAGSGYGRASAPTSQTSSSPADLGRFPASVSCRGSPMSVASGPLPARLPGAVGVAPASVDKAASPVASPSPPRDPRPRRLSSSAASASHEGTGPDQTEVARAAAFVSPSPVLPHAPDFSMNDHSLVSTLSAAADQTPSPAGVPSSPDEKEVPMETHAPSTTTTGPNTPSDHHHHHLPPLRPSPSLSQPSPSPRHQPSPSPVQSPISISPPLPLTPTPDLTLTLHLAHLSRAFLIASPVLAHFTAWALPSSSSNTTNSVAAAAASYDPATRTYSVDLTLLIPGAVARLRGAAAGRGEGVPEGEVLAHLDAVGELLAGMHRRRRVCAGGLEEGEVGWGDGGRDGRGLLGVDALWRLGGVREGLGLDGRWVEWLRGCMGVFVGRLGGVEGWFGGLSGSGVVERDGEGEVLERALNVCLVFGWGEEFRAVAGRLAYVCAVGEDAETGERVLVKPDGRRVEEGVCGKKAVGECAVVLVCFARKGC